MKKSFPKGLPCFLVVLGTISLGTAAPFSSIIGFGDSLTDVGNVAGITTPGNAPVIQGYYQETHFSDNVIWIETLSTYWGLPAPTPGRGNSTSLPALTSGTDWAWGGSEAGSGFANVSGVTEPVPNLLTETAEYLASNTPAHDALFSIWSGADNLLVGGKFGPQAAADAVAAVKTAIEDLQAAGARHFLIFNMPKMGDTPDAISGGPVSIAAANLYADSYNAALDIALDELRIDPDFLDTHIYFVNAYTLLEEIVATVNGGGTYVPDFFVPGSPVAISNVTDEGLDYYNTHSQTYPANYLFWDSVHPTTQGHQVVAGAALAAIVPEPAPHTLLAAGLAALVLARRRKKGC